METKRIEQMIKQLQHLSEIVKNNENAENTKLTHETLAAIEKMKLDLLTKLYSMETKQIKISELVPQGYEIDKEQSTFENIILKPIEVKLPLSVYTIPNRNYCIDEWGNIRKCLEIYSRNYLSTENRAKAFLALMQLVELRDAWNEGWRADWKNGISKYCIKFFQGELEIEHSCYTNFPLHFKTQKLADKFAEQFKDLINEAKELL